MATQQIDEYYESLAYWKQQAQDYEQALRDIEYNTIMNMTAEIEQLKAELRTSDLNRQSLWADSVKMADELNYIKAKHTEEIAALKSKLKIAVEALKQYGGASVYVASEDCNISVAQRALKEIGEG